MPITPLFMTPAYGETLSDRFRCSTPPCPLVPVSSALGRSAVRAIPILTASPGLVFEFDVGSGAFLRQTTVVGQLYLDRAETLGRGKWNVNVSYQVARIDSYGGTDLSDLRDSRSQRREIATASASPTYPLASTPTK